MPSLKDLEFLGINLEAAQQTPFIAVTSSPLKNKIGTHLGIYGIKFDRETKNCTIFNTEKYCNSGKQLKAVPYFLMKENKVVEQFGTNHIYIGVEHNTWDIHVQNYGSDGSCIQNINIAKQESNLLQAIIKQQKEIKEELASCDMAILAKNLKDPLISSFAESDSSIDQQQSSQPTNLQRNEELNKQHEIIAMRLLIEKIGIQYNNIRNECIAVLMENLKKTFNKDAKKLEKEQQVLIGNHKQAIIYTQVISIPADKDFFKNFLLAQFNLECRFIDKNNIKYIPVSSKEFDTILAQAQHEGKNQSAKPYNIFGDSKIGNLFFKADNCVNYVIELLRGIIPQKESTDWYYSGGQTFNKLSRIEIFKSIINEYASHGLVKTIIGEDKANNLLKKINNFFARFCFANNDPKFDSRLYLTLQEYKECDNYAKKHLSFFDQKLRDEFYEKLENCYQAQAEILPPYSMKKLLIL